LKIDEFKNCFLRDSYYSSEHREYISQQMGRWSRAQRSRELARWRAEHYSNVSYDLNIVLLPALNLEGTEEIHVTLEGDADRLILDWRTRPPHWQATSTVSELTV